MAAAAAAAAADHQKIHPVDLEASQPSAPLVPRNYSRSDKGDPETLPPIQRTIPVSHSKPPKRRRSCCCRCLCWTLLALIVLVVAVGATAGILYWVFDPKIPKYSVDRLRVAAFDVDANLTASATFDVTVTARNPNKKIGIYYLGGSSLSAWYQETNLCSGSFPKFYQGHRNTTVLTVVLNGRTQLTSALRSQLQQQQQTGSIPLKVRGDVPLKVKLGKLKLWKMTFRVRCDLVANSLTANNQISLRSSHCKIRLKR